MTPAVTPQPAPQPTPPDQAINSVMQNDVTPTPAAPPKQGFWRTLLMGAMNGLAGSKGATSFGGGAAGGAAGQLAQQQQQVENQQAASVNASNIRFRDAQSALAAANLTRQDQEMHQAGEEFQMKRDKFAQDQVDFNEKHFGISYRPVPNTNEAAMQYLQQATTNDQAGAHVPAGIVMSPSTIYVPVQDAENSPLKEYNYLQKMGPLFGLPVPSRSDYLGANTQQRRMMLEPVQNLVSGHARNGQPLAAQALDSQVGYMESALKTYSARADADPDVVAQGKSTLDLLKAQQQAQQDTEDRKFQHQKELANARGSSYGQNRVVSWLDDKNVMHIGYAKDMPADAAPVAPGAKSENQMAAFDEMQGSSKNLRGAISRMEPMSPSNIAKIQTALRDGHGIVPAELKAKGMDALSDAQKDFVVWATQMNERAMSLRSVQGLGQGSEDMRAAIRATLPGAGSGDKKMMLKQLDAFNDLVAKLRNRVPRTPATAKAEQVAPAAAAPTERPPLSQFEKK